MKTLTKKSLENLASKFEAISDQENVQYTGKAYFYYSNGVPAGHYGTSNDIKVLGEGGWNDNDINLIKSGNLTDKQIEDFGTYFSASSNITAKDAIIKLFSGSLNITAGYTFSNAARTYCDCTANFAWVEYNPNNIAFNDYYQIKNVLAHESVHVNQCGDGIWNNLTPEQKQLYAYWEQVKDPSFQDTPRDWQEKYLKKLEDYERDYGDGKSLAAIKAELGIDW